MGLVVKEVVQAPPKFCQSFTPIYECLLDRRTSILRNLSFPRRHPREEVGRATRNTADVSQRYSDVVKFRGVRAGANRGVSDWGLAL